MVVRLMEGLKRQSKSSRVFRSRKAAALPHCPQLAGSCPLSGPFRLLRLPLRRGPLGGRRCSRPYPFLWFASGCRRGAVAVSAVPSSAPATPSLRTERFFPSDLVHRPSSFPAVSPPLRRREFFHRFSLFLWYNRGEWDRGGGGPGDRGRRRRQGCARRAGDLRYRSAFAAVAVKAEACGNLVTVHMQRGQSVKKGNLLLTIDPRPYQAALDQAQANLEQDEAEVVTDGQPQLCSRARVAVKNQAKPAAAPQRATP